LRDFSYAKELGVAIQDAKGKVLHQNYQPTANLGKNFQLSTPEHTLNSGDEGSKEFSLAISLSMTCPINFERLTTSKCSNMLTT